MLQESKALVIRAAQCIASFQDSCSRSLSSLLIISMIWLFTTFHYFSSFGDSCSRSLSSSLIRLHVHYFSLFWGSWSMFGLNFIDQLHYAFPLLLYFFTKQMPKASHWFEIQTLNDHNVLKNGMFCKVWRHLGWVVYFSLTDVFKTIHLPRKEIKIIQWLPQGGDFTKGDGTGGRWVCCSSEKFHLVNSLPLTWTTFHAQKISKNPWIRIRTIYS